MFSGGLDSSFLADCLKKNLLPFDAFHVCTPSNLGEGETDIANLHASDLSINLHFVQADESSGSRKNPSPIIPLSPCDIEVLPLIFWEESSNPNFFDKRVVINGHGGDATFFSSGDPKLPFELLKSGRIKDAWETLNSYCNVSGLTYGQCIIRAFSSNLSYQTKRYKHVCQWMNILPDSRDNVHPMLHNIRGSDKTYISGVLDMIFSNLPFDPRPKYQTFHPLAFPNIINLALLMDRSQFFKQDLDRFCYRYAAMTSTKSSYPSRLPKREASAIMFLALNTIFQELDEELSKDKFLHNIGISVEKIREILRYNSTINLTPDFPSIIRAISIMKYLRTWVKV